MEPMTDDNTNENVEDNCKYNNEDCNPRLKVNKIIFQDPDAPWEKPQLPPIKVTNNNPRVSGNLINSR